MIDIERGATARKAPKKEEVSSEFIGHVGLKWYIKTDDGKEVPIEEYRKQRALAQRSLSLDESGEIIAKGVRVIDLPEEYQRMLLDLLKEEEEKVEIPIQSLTVSCRPDLDRERLQSSYRKRVQSAIYGVCRYTLDGKTGKNLVEQPLSCLKDYVKKTPANNERFLFEGIFGYVKATTGKEWKKYQNEDEFIQAHELALKKIEEARLELMDRRRQYQR